MAGPDGGFSTDLGWDVRSVERMFEDEEADLARSEYIPDPTPVTRRIRRVPQPAGGFLPVGSFERIRLGDPRGLHPVEDLPAHIVGLAVDYLSRVACGVSAVSAFRIPLVGARLVGRSPDAERLLEDIDGFGDASIAAACMLCGYDVASRRGPGFWKGPVRSPGPETVWNVRRMVSRTLAFLDAYGPVVWEGFTFEGAYTDLITSGDGDFLTADTLWDMKVSRHEPNPVYTLQLLVYWRMGLRSVHPVYARIRRLGLFNPRMDVVHVIDVDSIPPTVSERVDHEVIGYPAARPNASGPSPGTAVGGAVA